ncbi:hypothetical protein AC579_10448 [Pseudocercospora musae]|uniref:F-box domain-containing protein n=1 Tax=Pseudocercospora musae TaxID=113226 RepID=A0A139I0C1_9PEZI|nr:hypothetical protein AC579_10448 [Pseudocercospora musae]
MSGMIPPTRSPTTTGVEHNASATTSLGNLDKLPLELVHWILSMLDVQTLSRITRTCMRGIAVVESLLEYRDLVRYAPQAIAALGSTKLLHRYSAHALYTALRSASCWSCGDFGPFLFLPTCDRCCYECLSRNQSLWAIPCSEAQEAFDLCAASIKNLPLLHSLPGRYHVKHSVTSKRRLQLVSVRAAKELAIKQGKSVEYLKHYIQNRRIAGLPLDKYYKLRWLLEAPLQAPGNSILFQPTQANVPNDKFCGMASVPFPSLSTGSRIENGLWCLGCEKACREWSPNRPHAALSHLVASGVDVKRTLYTMQHVARSEKEFVEHITKCAGAKEMLPGVEAKLQDVILA